MIEAPIEFARLRRLRDSFLIAAEHAENTRKSYEYAMRNYRAWCSSLGVTPIPVDAETFSLWLTHLLDTGRKVSTALAYAAAGAHAHRAAGFASPFTRAVRGMIIGARRLRGERVDQVKALTLEQLGQISAALMAENLRIATRVQYDNRVACRNRALVLLGFASALRSASLARLQLEDVRIEKRGLEIWVRREKQDRLGKGRSVIVPVASDPAICPVLALQEWLERRGDFAGPVFIRLNRIKKRSPIQAERITQIVKDCVQMIGLNPKEYGCHSLRSGFVTAAAEHAIAEALIAEQTGHRDRDCLRKYIRRVDGWRNNAAGQLGL